MTKEAIDKQDKLIMRELIANPRLSDNKISQVTDIPVKTVNRKRKKLEEKGILNYRVHINNGYGGTKSFSALAQFIVIFRHGITRRGFLENLDRVGFSDLDIKHIKNAYIGEVDGRVTFSLILESRAQEDLLEIFNTEIIGKLHNMVGHDSIHETKVINLHSNIISLHNYIEGLNTSNGILKKNWPKENIFVS